MAVVAEQIWSRRWAPWAGFKRLAASAAGGNFEVEHLDSSPGSTLRSRSRNANRDDLLDESIDILTESPGNRNRRRNVTRESQEVRT